MQDSTEVLEAWTDPLKGAEEDLFEKNEITGLKLKIEHVS